MFKEILINHYQNKPKSEIQDFIKLIYQATFGGKHLNTNEETSLNYLFAECNQIENNKTLEPLYEVISNDYIRVNLVPYINSNFSLEILNKEFINQKSNNSLILLEEYLNIFINLVKDKTIKLDINEVESFITNYRLENYPVYHHSETYRNCYTPHYRVLPISFIDYLNSK